MSLTIPASRTKWTRGITLAAVHAGYAVMNYELYNGRWCVNVFCGFDLDADNIIAAKWKTETIQDFYKRVLTDETV